MGEEGGTQVLNVLYSPVEEGPLILFKKNSPALGFGDIKMRNIASLTLNSQLVLHLSFQRYLCSPLRRGASFS